MWRRYAFTIVFNINNKQLLKMWMYPLTATTSQFFVGGCLGILWFIATGRRPVIKASVLKSVFPLALVRSSPLNSCSKNRLTLAGPCALKAPQNCTLCTHPCSLLLVWCTLHRHNSATQPSVSRERKDNRCCCCYCRCFPKSKRRRSTFSALLVIVYPSEQRSQVLLLEEVTNCLIM
jgi:hypothetical protein